MSLVIFKNLPDTTTPLTAENLNSNFEYLDDKASLATNYLTDEVKIGTWINGKPLYRKVITFNDTVSTNTTFTKAHEIQNANIVLVKDAYMINNVNYATYHLNMVGYGGNLTDKTYLYADRTNVYIYANGGWNTGWDKVIVLEYTKTTD